MANIAAPRPGDTIELALNNGIKLSLPIASVVSYNPTNDSWLVRAYNKELRLIAGDGYAPSIVELWVSTTVEPTVWRLR